MRAQFHLALALPFALAACSQPITGADAGPAGIDTGPPATDAGRDAGATMTDGGGLDAGVDAGPPALPGITVIGGLTTAGTGVSVSGTLTVMHLGFGWSEPACAGTVCAYGALAPVAVVRP